jgi:hypothetical protein
VVIGTYSMVEEVEPGSSAQVEPDQPAGQHRVEQRGLTGTSYL